MKLLILTFSILFLASCTQYRYDVTYEKCNGQTGSTNYIVDDTLFDRYYFIYNRPILDSSKLLYTQGGGYSNICYFSYTATPLQ